MEKEYPSDVYRECLRNHAASLGSYATDGCGEFTLDHTSLSTLQCAACGCHRNFHRKVSYCNSNSRSRGDPVERVDYGEDGGTGGRPPVLLECSTEGGARSGKKRFRTKFTAEQKEKMLEFAEKLGWRLQRRDEEDQVDKFCRGIGVSRQVFKVWMHNHKNTSSVSTCNASSLTTP